MQVGLNRATRCLKAGYGGEPMPQKIPACRFAAA
jgi:hypothetical protein